MNENLIGLFAESRAGHDKGKVFIIVSAEAEYAGIADGKSRIIENPKQKNIKHLSIIKKETPLREKLLANNPVSNEEIKYALKCYKAITIKD
ncbi:MAG: KOW domain-containing RNA-binding protein [Lachnospiraceae bacterium]|nr:KOW domain-containing RNA-binding protein [Lachnospiraceae bacterium]